MGRIGIRAISLGLFVLALAASPALAAPAVSGEYPLLSEIDANNKIIEGPDGNMWVTLSGPVKDVAKVTPAGAVTEYDLGVEGASGIARGPEGSLWITENGGVTKFSPASPEGSKVTTPIGAIATFHSIVLGPDGNLWVATSENLVRVPPANPAGAKAFPVAELSPRDIDVAGSLLVIADFSSRVLTATTAEPPVTVSYKLNGGSQGVAGDPDGQIAFSQQTVQPTEFGLLAPPGPPQLTLSAGTDPFGVAFGSDKAFWIAQFAKDTVTRLTTANAASTLTPGFATGSGPRQIASGPGNTLWVTLDNTDKIGRVSGLEPPVVEPIVTPAPPPETKITKGPKGKVTTHRKLTTVKFRFSSTSAGASFQCRLLGLGGKKAKASKATPFRTCVSPKAYHLKPGRYRFEVRAVLAGLVDPTPAKRSFRVVRVPSHRHP